MNVDRMLREISPRQLFEWIAFGQLEPFGPERADTNAGYIVQTLANLHRAKSRRAYTLAESTLKFGDANVAAKQTKQDWREMKMIGQMMSAAYAEPEKPRTRRFRRPDGDHSR